jgi:hypothetical protein
MTRRDTRGPADTGSMGALRRLVGWLWAGANARLGIVATEDESAYYALADEYLDRVAADPSERRSAPGRSGKASAIDEGAASGSSSA